MVTAELVADGLAFPEGPVHCSDGSVLVVEIRTGMLARIDTSDGSVTRVAHCGGGPNGAAPGPNGLIAIANNGGFSWGDGPDPTITTLHEADYLGGSLQLVDPASGDVTTLFTSSSGGPLLGPNDLVYDAAGGLWVTDAGKRWSRSLDIGSVHYVEPGHGSIREVIFPLLQPNGIGISPEGDRLYVSETSPGRLWWWPILDHGVVDVGGPGPGGGRLLHGFDGFQPLDSLAVDSEGNVCVATLMSGVISVVSPHGELLDRIALPEHDSHVTNICFGGADLRTAYVTSAGLGRLYSIPWPCAGLATTFGV